MTQSYTDEFVDNAQNGSTARQGWLSTLAKAPASEVLKLWEAMVAPESQVLRPAETGMVMVRGRTGGAGSVGSAACTDRATKQAEQARQSASSRNRAGAATLIDRSAPTQRPHPQQARRPGCQTASVR